MNTRLLVALVLICASTFSAAEPSNDRDTNATLDQQRVEAENDASIEQNRLIFPSLPDLCLVNDELPGCKSTKQRG